jgi:cupin fold WbuC family metalloprotein
MMLEQIDHRGRVVAHLVRSAYRPAASHFLTAPEAEQQLGLIVRAAGEAIRPHVHTPIQRQVTGTAEALLIQRGRAELTLYTEDGEEIARRELAAGDVVVLLSGGHGLRMLEDTVMVEVKQGPYAGAADKVFLGEGDGGTRQ